MGAPAQSTEQVRRWRAGGTAYTTFRFSLLYIYLLKGRVYENAGREGTTCLPQIRRIFQDG